MNSRQLEAFRAIARAGTVTAAANTLHISQPAVSRLLAHLEQRLGFALFDRARGRLRLSAEGSAFLQEVDQHFVGLDAVRAAAERIAADGTGSLRAVGIPSATSGVLPLAVAVLLKQHPRVALTLDTDTTDAIPGLVARGTFDVGFATAPVPSTAPVDSQVLATRSWVLVVPGSDPLAGSAAVSLRTLAGRTLVGFLPGMGLRRVLDDALTDAAVDVRFSPCARSVESVCALAVATGNAALVHPFAAHVARMHQLAPVVVSDLPPLDLVAVTPTQTPVSRLAASFVAGVASRIHVIE